MKIIVKKLQGGECRLEVTPTTLIIEIKREVFKSLGIPTAEQKLLLLGRTLADEQMVSSYPSIKEGTKLNLIVKKPEGLFEVSVKHFKNHGMSEKEAIDTANRLLKIVEEKVYSMSWDDLDRLCYNCLLEENGEARLPVDPDRQCEDSVGL